MATFLVPAAIALAAGSVFRLTAAELSGLFLVGVTPGALAAEREICEEGLRLAHRRKLPGVGCADGAGDDSLAGGLSGQTV